MTNASLKALVASVVVLAGCASPPGTHFWYANDTLTSQRIAEVVRANPPGPGQNIRVVTLGSSPTISQHIVQIRHGEELHVHREHDLTVYMLSGAGMMRIGEDVFPLRQDDSLLIPRGVPHAFTNGSRQPAVALVSFCPAFDGRDTVLIGTVEEKKIQELHAKEVGVGNPSEERASS